MNSSIKEELIAHCMWLLERCKSNPKLLESLKGFGEEITLTFNPQIPLQLHFSGIAETCPKLSVALDSNYFEWSIDNVSAGVGKKRAAFDDETGSEFLELLKHHAMAVCRRDVMERWKERIEIAADKMYAEAFQ